MAFFAGNAVSVFNVRAEEEAAHRANNNNKHDEWLEECWDCGNSELRLKILCLCAKRVKTNCLEARKIRASSIFADGIKARVGCFADLEVSNGLLANNLQANKICVQEICASNLVVENAKFNQAEICQKFRATMAFAADTLYTLGSPVNFDTIIDDPNGNISLAPTFYTAPVSGYYIVTLQIDQRDLAGAAPIMGIPASNLVIDVNGLPFRQTYSPFLSFHNGQNANISGLISLRAGDKVSARYNILVMTDGGGFGNYVGTVVVKGNGTEENESFLKIHYLSSNDCPGTVPPCLFPCVQPVCDQIINHPCPPCHENPPICVGV